MKAFKLIRAMIILGGIFLSACAGAPANSPAPSTASPGGDKPLFTEVEFTGVIEGMQGDQWVIDGQTVQVASSAIQDGPFVIGDSVKVEALVAADGSVTARRVESPSAADLAGTATSIPEAASTELPVVFDDSGTEAVGKVEALTDTSITLGGQTYPFAPGAEIKGVIAVGTIVKLHFVANADGTLSVREVEITDPTQINGNSNDDNSNNVNTNDDNSNNANTNDDNSNNNANASNDDNGNDDNSNNNGNGGSNDDNGNNNSNGGHDDNSNDSNGNG